MKVVVAGSRGFDDYKLLKETLDKYTISEGISGTANGADKLGERYFEEMGIPCTKFPAEWDRYGKRAGHLRNAEMASYGDFAVIFWDGSSKGTLNMINEMKSLKKNYVVIKFSYGILLPKVDEYWEEW